MKITINLPLSSEDEAKYEGTGEYRCPSEGELFASCGDNIISTATGSEWQKSIILRERYRWPTINGVPMGGWGIAEDESGMWLFENPAKIIDNRWAAVGGFVFHVKNISRIGIPVPTIADWTKPVINPHWKG